MLEWIKDVRDIGRAVLSDRTILKYNAKGLLFEGPLDEHQIQPNSVDLTLGPTWKKPLPNDKLRVAADIADPRVFKMVGCIDSSRKVAYEEGKFIDINGRLGYVIQPNEFILMASNEILNIPNGILSFVQGRSSIARLAIQTEDAGLIDAGFRGTITFEVKNHSEHPIILYAGTRIAQTYFFKSQYANRTYGKFLSSKYLNQIDATGSKLYQDHEFQ